MTKRRPNQYEKASPVYSMQKRITDRLWASAVGKIRAGRVERDAVLASGRPDQATGFDVDCPAITGGAKENHGIFGPVARA